MTTNRPPRPRLMSAEAMANRAPSGAGVSDGELYSRLEDALAALPAPERAAAVVAFGLDEGAAGVAMELDLSPDDAEALARSALQLLRGALGDVEGGDTPEAYARLARRRRRVGNHRPGDTLDAGR